MQGWTIEYEPDELLGFPECEFRDVAGGLSASAIGLLRKSGGLSAKLEGDGSEKTESSPGTLESISKLFEMFKLY